MGFLADIMASMVTSVVGAVGSLLCAPLYDKMKASMDVLNAPESFSQDVKELNDLINKIKGLSRASHIEEWLSKAEDIMEKVPQVLLQRGRSSSQNHRSQLSCCIIGHGVSRCKIHMKVRKLTIQGKNILCCADLKKETVEHITGVPDIGDRSTAGRNLRRVTDMLEDDEVSIIGVWGPGGVGKTTLVNALNNKLEGTSLFKLVIFIPLTKDTNENEVQKAISTRLSLEVDGMNANSVANLIHNRLQREKFLIILDNVWEPIMLESIGIPENQKGSKVVLTTRLEDVCMGMKAKVIKIEYLTTEEAWQLFAEKAGEVVNDPKIQPLAEAVCSECGGLPLALVAVGSAMRGKSNIHVWNNAINELQCSTPIHGIESKVYNPLKLSYDSLAGDTPKACFLYCSLYPEGYQIEKSELVRCWMAENIIGEEQIYESAYSKGLDLIENLKSSCLLMDVQFALEVKLHDVVRDVAIRIGKLNGTSIIFSGHGITKNSIIEWPEKVENTKWISFVDNKKIELPKYKEDFPKATSLLLFRTGETVHVPEEFLKGFQALRVLLLMYCSSDLEELQCGAKLMVLDLSYSRIYKLPRGVEQLTKLKVLVLKGTRKLRTIEVDVILSLSALEILDTRGSSYKWPTMRKSESKEIVLQDLSRLMSLKEVYLTLADVEATYEECSWMERLKSFYFNYDTCLGIFFPDRVIAIKIHNFEGKKIGSFVLHAKILGLDGSFLENVSEIFPNPNDQSSSKIKSLYIIMCSLSIELTKLAPKSSAFLNLEYLGLFQCQKVRRLSQVANAFGTTFPKLSCLEIDLCPELENVDMVLPELEKLIIRRCQNITEVFHGSSSAKNQVVAPKLMHLILGDLDNLQSLCSYNPSEQQWQSLKILEVKECPKLKKLPHMTSVKEIRGSEEWWSNLEWDIETKAHYSKFFKQWDDI